MDDRLPYITLDKIGRRVFVEVLVGNQKKQFAPTLAGTKKIAKFLVAQGATTVLHSSTMDHYDEYGVKIDILEAVHQEFKKLCHPRPICWWILMVYSFSTINYTAVKCIDTPFGSEDEARELIKDLTASASYAKHQFYIVAVFADGNIAIDKWERK